MVAPTQALPDPTARPSLLHGFSSLVIPGLGQFTAGKRLRGIGILLSTATLAGLSVWAVAQQARFPDYRLSAQVFSRILGQSAALLLFLRAIRFLLNRRVLKDVAAQAIVRTALDLVYFLAVFLVSDSILDLAGTVAELEEVYGLTGVFAAAGLAAFWFWQVSDAAVLGTGSMAPGILFACILIFALGWNITEIDLPKAVREYRDTQVILRRIFWPWRVAFEFEVISIDSSAKIQAPCPEGAAGPSVNQPSAEGAWISATPTCGDLSTRDFSTGSLVLGTLLTIEGGGFQPGAEVEILWKNPIGNPFRPRGVGETTIEIDSRGEFQTQLNIPEAAIPSTALGDQIHTLLVIQESGEVFTGRLSREMRLAMVGIIETIMLGLMATFFGIILAIPISFLAARNLMSPIVTSVASLVGGLVFLVPAIWLAGMGAVRVSARFGGLETAPLPTAGLLLVAVVGLGYSGWRVGSWLITRLVERSTGLAGKLAIPIGAAALGAGAGYFLGIGFSRGIVSIPLGEEAAALFEDRIALGGAVLVGLASLIGAYRSQAGGQVRIGSIVYTIVRTIMNIIRSIEPLIWAVVGIIWIGPGPFAGTIALTLHTIAALGKLYSEAIESIDPGPIEAIQSTGGNRLQTIMYAVMPQVVPPFISFTIYRWDINVRLSTIIGFVGGGGIGFILIQWIRTFQYDAAGIAVWLITITVAALDFVSSEIRERFI